MSTPAPWLQTRPLSLSARYVAAVALVAASMAAAEVFYRFFDTTRLSMIFLVGVLVAAVTLGSGPAYLASVLAFFAYNFYLVEPRFSFQGITPEDVLLLVVFLAVSLLTGRLAGKVRDDAQRATLRARTTSALFEASQQFSSTGDEAEICDHLVRQVAAATRGEAELVRAEGRWRAPEDSPGAPAPAAPEEAALRTGWRSRVLRHGQADLGTLMWRPGAGAQLDEQEELIAVLADLGGAALARARLARVNAEMEALTRTEQLRNALLSSISHDLRTPLAAILASSTSLREFGPSFSDDVKADLIQTIEEEAERLNRMVANLLNMTRVESGALILHPDCIDVSEVVDRLRQRFARIAAGRRLEVRAAGAPLFAEADPMLLEQALANVIENALRFSSEDSPVIIETRPGAEGRLEVAVCDRGPGVPAEERERIFEKFYRTADAAAVPGTGLGLSITRGLVEAMGGSATAQARADGRSGLTVILTLAACEP